MPTKIEEVTDPEILKAFRNSGKGEPAPAAPAPGRKEDKGSGGRMGALEDIGRSAATGVRSGTEDLLGFAGNAAKTNGAVAAWAARMLGVDEETANSIGEAASWLHPGAMLPSGDTVRHLTDPLVAATGTEDILAHDPQTMGGKFARTVGEFAPSAAAGPGRVGVKIAEAVVPGIASEAAGQMLPTHEAYARAAAALVAGSPIAFFGQVGKGGANAIAKAVKGATPQQIDEAEALFQSAQKTGTPITRFEALQQVTAGATRSGDMQRFVEGEGGLKEFFAARPGQVERSTGKVLDAVSAPRRSPSTLGPEAGDVAKEVVTDARQLINKITEPLYRKAETQRVPAADFAQLTALPGWDEAAKAIKADPQLARYVAGLPEDSVGFLNEVQKYLNTQGENAAGALNAQKNQQRAAGYGTDAGTVRKAAENASPEFKQAVSTQADLRKQYLDPLLQGPMGKLAKEDVPTREAIGALFPTNPLPNSEAEISATVGALAKKRPHVARELVRAHIESVFNEATQSLMSGANQFGGAKFAAVLRGNKQQAANLKAAIEALPQGKRLYTGVDKYLTILEAQGTRQPIGSRTDFNKAIREELKGGAPVKTAATVTAGGLFTWPRKALEAVERWNVGRNVDEIARLIVDPRAGKEFRKLAGAGGQTAARIAAAITLITVAGANSTPPVKPEK